MEWTLGAAHKLGVKSVLEGVEKHSDLMLAREMGFDYVQGFLFRERFLCTGNLAAAGAS